LGILKLISFKETFIQLKEINFNSSQRNNMGSLTVIFGPMFSGKTTRLIQELTRFVDVTSESHSTKCLLINHVFDDRNPEIGVSSHGSSFKGVSELIDITQTAKLESVDYKKYNVIGIDEGQFFEDLEIVQQWVNEDKNVIISGLISDSFMKPFGKIYTLIPFSDNVIQCHAICSECLNQHNKVITPDSLSAMKAAFTYRLENSNSQISIGASDKYVPVCRHHYNLFKNKII
jgi:thymidine kinase